MFNLLNTQRAQSSNAYSSSDLLLNNMGYFKDRSLNGTKNSCHNLPIWSTKRAAIIEEPVSTLTSASSSRVVAVSLPLFKTNSIHQTDNSTQSNKMELLSTSVGSTTSSVVIVEENSDEHFNRHLENLRADKNDLESDEEEKQKKGDYNENDDEEGDNDDDESTYGDDLTNIENETLNNKLNKSEETDEDDDLLNNDEEPKVFQVEDVDLPSLVTSNLNSPNLISLTNSNSLFSKKTVNLSETNCKSSSTLTGTTITTSQIVSLHPKLANSLVNSIQSNSNQIKLNHNHNIQNNASSSSNVSQSLNQRSSNANSISTSNNNNEIKIYKMNNEKSIAALSKISNAAIDSSAPTPLIFSRSSSMTSLNSFDVKSVHSSVASEYSQVTSPSNGKHLEPEKENDFDYLDEFDLMPESPIAAQHDSSFLLAQRSKHKQQQIYCRQAASIAMIAPTTTPSNSLNEPTNVNGCLVEKQINNLPIFGGVSTQMNQTYAFQQNQLVKYPNSSHQVNPNCCSIKSVDSINTLKEQQTQVQQNESSKPWKQCIFSTANLINETNTNTIMPLTNSTNLIHNDLSQMISRMAITNTSRSETVPIETATKQDQIKSSESVYSTSSLSSSSSSSSGSLVNSNLVTPLSKQQPTTIVSNTLNSNQTTTLGANSINSSHTPPVKLLPTQKFVTNTQLTNLAPPVQSVPLKPAQSTLNTVVQYSAVLPQPAMSVTYAFMKNSQISSSNQNYSMGLPSSNNISITAPKFASTVNYLTEACSSQLTSNSSSVSVNYQPTNQPIIVNCVQAPILPCNNKVGVPPMSQPVNNFNVNVYQPKFLQSNNYQSYSNKNNDPAEFNVTNIQSNNPVLVANQMNPIQSNNFRPILPSSLPPTSSISNCSTALPSQPQTQSPTSNSNLDSESPYVYSVENRLVDQFRKYKPKPAIEGCEEETGVERSCPSSPQESICSRMSELSVPSLIRQDISSRTDQFQNYANNKNSMGNDFRALFKKLNETSNTKPYSGVESQAKGSLFTKPTNEMRIYENEEEDEKPKVFFNYDEETPNLAEPLNFNFNHQKPHANLNPIYGNTQYSMSNHYSFNRASTNNNFYNLSNDPPSQIYSPKVFQNEGSNSRYSSASSLDQDDDDRFLNIKSSKPILTNEKSSNKTQKVEFVEVEDVEEATGEGEEDLNAKSGIVFNNEANEDFETNNDEYSNNTNNLTFSISNATKPMNTPAGFGSMSGASFIDVESDGEEENSNKSSQGSKIEAHDDAQIRYDQQLQQEQRLQQERQDQQDQDDQDLLENFINEMLPPVQSNLTLNNNITNCSTNVNPATSVTNQTNKISEKTTQVVSSNKEPKRKSLNSENLAVESAKTSTKTVQLVNQMKQSKPTSSTTGSTISKTKQPTEKPIIPIKSTNNPAGTSVTSDESKMVKKPIKKRLSEESIKPVSSFQVPSSKVDPKANFKFGQHQYGKVLSSHLPTSSSSSTLASSANHSTKSTTKQSNTDSKERSTNLHSNMPAPIINMTKTAQLRASKLVGSTTNTKKSTMNQNLNISFSSVSSFNSANGSTLATQLQKFSTLKHQVSSSNILNLKQKQKQETLNNKQTSLETSCAAASNNHQITNNEQTTLLSQHHLHSNLDPTNNRRKSFSFGSTLTTTTTTHNGHSAAINSNTALATGTSSKADKQTKTSSSNECCSSNTNRNVKTNNRTTTEPHRVGTTSLTSKLK